MFQLWPVAVVAVYLWSFFTSLFCKWQVCLIAATHRDISVYVCLCVQPPSESIALVQEEKHDQTELTCCGCE